MRGQRIGRREGVRRYHVELNGRRTTITLDRNLSNWLALHLEAYPEGPDQPESADTHRAIREWMQGQIDWLDKPPGARVSHWLYCQALEAVVHPDLRQLRDAFG